MFERKRRDERGRGRGFKRVMFKGVIDNDGKGARVMMSLSSCVGLLIIFGSLVNPPTF